MEQAVTENAMGVTNFNSLLRSPPVKHSDEAKNAAKELMRVLSPNKPNEDILTAEDFDYLSNLWFKIDNEPTTNSEKNEASKQADAIRTFLDKSENIDQAILVKLGQFPDSFKTYIDLAYYDKKFRDTDGDQVPNDQEQEGGTDPQNPDSNSKPEPETFAYSTITSPDVIRDAQALHDIVKNATGITVQSPSELMRAIEAVSEFSQQAFKTQDSMSSLTGLGGYNPQNAARVILLDYLNSMVNSYSKYVAGYAFEYLLAGMAGGKQMGVSSAEDGTDNKTMGAIDFSIGKDYRGSCKLYQDWKGIKQSVKGFKLNGSVFYVIAIKNTSLQEQQNEQKGVLSITLNTIEIKRTSDLQPITIHNRDDIINQLKSLRLAPKNLRRAGDAFNVDIGNTRKRATHYYQFKVGERQYPVLVYGNSTKHFINISEQLYNEADGKLKTKATVYFAKNNTKDFRQQLSESFDEQSKEILQAFTKIVDNIKNTKEQTQRYFSTGDSSAGIEAFTAVRDTQQNLENLTTSIAGKEGTEDIKSKAGLNEAFSVPKADLTKNGYEGSPHPAAIWHDRQILDNIDLNKFKDMAVNMALRDDTKSESQLKKVASRMRQLVAVIPAIPSESKSQYVKDLFALIDSIYKHWKDRDDGTWFLNNFTKELRSYRSSDIDKLTNQYMGAAELSDEELEARQAAQDAALAAQAEKEQEAGQVSVTSPTFKTSRLPSNLQDYNAVMDRMFGKSTNLRQRVQDLQELGVLFGKSEEEFRKETEEMNELDFFSKVVMMDYLVEIAKGFDSTAGRYLLEYLLAVVAKGRVTGADLGESGMAGAVDFRSAEGFGSSKFLSSYDDALQSIQSFKEGETVTYVVAVREGNPRELQTRAPSPLKLQSIKMHIFDITRTGSSFDIEIDDGSGGKKLVKLGNYPRFFRKDKEENRTHLDIGKIAEANQSNAFTIPLVFTTEEGTKTYRQMMSTSLGAIKGSLLTFVKDLFDGLKKADEMSRKYVVTGDPEDGGKALEGLEESVIPLMSLRRYRGQQEEVDIFSE
jgi:hypothetical protein